MASRRPPPMTCPVWNTRTRTFWKWAVELGGTWGNRVAKHAMEARYAVERGDCITARKELKRAVKVARERFHGARWNRLNPFGKRQQPRRS